MRTVFERINRNSLRLYEMPLGGVKAEKKDGDMNYLFEGRLR